MPSTPRTVRVVAVVTALVSLVIALAVRAVADGVVQQASDNICYAAMVYSTVVFLGPRLAPVVAGGIAVVFCWIVEFAQLTGVPAALSERSLLARLVLGVQFDAADVAWYPLGVVPLVALHLWIIRSR